MPPNPQKSALWQAFSYAWAFGYIVALPLVVLGFGGRALDRALGKTPWLFLLGLLLALVISSIWTFRTLLRLSKSVEDESHRKKPNRANGSSTPP
jgi:F0F1-type ATP synthase assembly protein I